MRNRLTITVLAAVIATTVLAEATIAAGRNYVDRRRSIRVGVLVAQEHKTSSWVTVEPSAGYIFYIMNERLDIKPAGWSFVNPLVGGKDSQRNFKAYWEVPLKQTTLENLAKFDVLYLSTKVAVDFQMDERDKLRRFVDGGGCLWVDNGYKDITTHMGFTTGSLVAYAFFLPGVNFLGPDTGSPYVAASLHPLLTNPFWLAPGEINNLDFVPTPGNRFYVEPGFMPGGSNLPSPNTLASVVAIAEDKPTIAVTEYGSGRVVVTSGFIGAKIQYPILSSNPVYMDRGLNLLLASPGNLKFAYNVIAWASSSTTLRGNYRRDGNSIENIGAPLVNKWSMPYTAGSADTEQSPVVWKNVVFVAAGNTLYALDAVPEEDLDMDGNPDDGTPDYSSNPTVDLLWKWTAPSVISSPTVANMIDPGGSGPAALHSKDFVLVTCADDKLVYVLEALPSVNGLVSGSPVDRSSDMWAFKSGDEPAAAMSAGYLAPPIVQNGWIYATAAEGWLYAYCPVLNRVGGDPDPYWRVRISSPSGNIKTAPVLAFAKNRSSGAVVQSVSFIGRPNGANVGDHIYSVPVFVSSDKLTPLNPPDLVNPPSSGGIKFRTSYSSYYISEYPAPQIWALDSEGDPVTVTNSTPDPTDYNSPGTVTVKIPSGDINPNIRVFMSYGIDYSQGVTHMAESYPIPPQPNGVAGTEMTADVTGTPAIGSNDAFYFGETLETAPAGSGKSSLYCVGFEGMNRGSRLKWSYFLHGGGVIPQATYKAMTGATSRGDLDVVDSEHKWGVYAYPTGSDTPVHVQNLEVVGTPAVTTDKVFVTAYTSDPGNPSLPRAYLLCFKADQTFTIRANMSFKDKSTKDNKTVTIWQPDLMFDDNSSSDAKDVSMLARQVGGDMVDYDSGTITINDFSRVRLRTYLNGNPNVILDAGVMTPSLPVWVFLDGTPIPTEQMDFSSWNNLLWALPIDHNNGANLCTGIHSSPVVIGDYVYLTCDDGNLIAVDASAEPMDTDYRILLKPLPATGGIGYNDVLTKRTARVPMDTKMDASATGGIKSSVSAAGGSLAALAGNALYVMNNPLTLVTDNRRVMEVGGDGKIVWSCDSVYEQKAVDAATGGTSVTTPVAVDLQPLNKPMVAQKFGGSDYLVVDSGNDRVIRIDRGGQVMWSLKTFSDPKNLLRSGEPKSLKSPADARAWSEIENDGGNRFYVLHCLVVDTGNFRILDIVDRYVLNSNGQVQGPELDSADKPIGHQLRWTTNTTYKDKRFAFNSIQRVPKYTAGALTGEEIWASISNYGLGTNGTPNDTQSVGGGNLGGAIVAMDYRTSTSSDGAWSYSNGSAVLSQLTTLYSGGVKIRLSGPRYFSVLGNTGELLICDSSAVYRAKASDGQISWQLTAADYRTLARKMTGKDSETVDVPFSPYRAIELPNSRYLIVNNYAGRTNGTTMMKFTGEVFEVNSNYASNGANLDIEWYAPNMVYTAGPPADIVQQMINAPNFDQPTCAQRLQ